MLSPSVVKLPASLHSCDLLLITVQGTAIGFEFVWLRSSLATTSVDFIVSSGLFVPQLFAASTRSGWAFNTSWTRLNFHETYMNIF